MKACVESTRQSLIATRDSDLEEKFLSFVEFALVARCLIKFSNEIIRWMLQKAS